MWRQRRFCGRHFVHKKRLLKYFQRSVRWVNCKLAMAVLTKRNIQEFKDKGFTQASYCILSSGQFGKYGYRSKTFRLIQFCKIEARNNRGYGITNSYPKKWWSFLDALASLDFKLSVGQSVTYRFSDSKASASVGRLSIYFTTQWPLWNLDVFGPELALWHLNPCVNTFLYSVTIYDPALISENHGDWHLCDIVLCISE